MFKKILLKNCLNLAESHENCQKFSEKIGNLGVFYKKVIELKSP